MTYLVSDGVVAYSISSNEFALYNSISEELIVLNEAGQMLWNMIIDHEDLCKLLKNSAFMQEIEGILNTLEEHGFIKCESK